MNGFIRKSAHFIMALLCPLVTAFIAVPARAQVDAEQVLNIGRNVLSMDDYMLAIQYFNQAIKAKPYLSDPYFFRALAKLELEDYKGAEEDCTLAIERNKFKPESYKLRGFARQYLGKDSLAIKDYDIGLQYNPQDRYFLYYKSVAQTQLKKYAEADSTFRTLLRLYPKFGDAHAAYGQMMVQRGDTAQALEEISKAVELTTGNIQPYLLRAEIAVRQKRWSEAVGDMDEAIRLKPHEADLYVNRAFVRYNLDDYFGAMADYNYALDLDAYNYSALFNRALLRYEVKDLNRAATDFEGVLRMQPDNFHALYNLGLVNLERHKYHAALDNFNRIARRYPRFYPALYARAECLRSLGDMRGAIASAHAADELIRGYVKNPVRNPLDRPAIQVGEANTRGNGSSPDPDTPEDENAVMERFNQLVTIGSASSAQLSYNDRIKGKVQDRDISVEPEPSYALSFNPTPESLKASSNYFRELDDFNQRGYIPEKIYVTAGAAAGGEGEYEKIFALADYYEKRVKESGARSADWLALGIARTMLKDYEAAVRAFSKCLELTPDLTTAMMGRAYAEQHLESVRDKQAAIADYDRALEKDPSLTYAWYNKGNILYGLGDYTSAIECNAKAIAADPSFGEAYFNRGIAYLRMGNRRLAFADLSKAGELGIIPSYNLLKRMK